MVLFDVESVVLLEVESVTIGSAAKLLPELASARFLDPLLTKGRMGAIVQQVPIQALIDPEAGLFSAACRARMLLA